MARIELVPEVFEDFERFFEHVFQHFLQHAASFDVSAAPARIQQIIDEIIQAIQVLTSSPNIGGPVGDGKRELVIGRGSRGYVALYRYVAELDTVFLIALRSQRELGYKHDV